MTQKPWNPGRFSREAAVAATLPPHEAAEMMRSLRAENKELRWDAAAAMASVGNANPDNCTVHNAPEPGQ